jgi:serine/threonine-protein kinase HipA
MTAAPTSEAFVWVWLPDAVDPVVAGRLTDRGDVVSFTYGRTYRDRADAIAIFLPELPLIRGEQVPELGTIHGSIGDAGPDAWGRRLVELRHDGGHDPAPLDYLLEAGSDRIGALDFQVSDTEYLARTRPVGSLAELLDAAEKVERQEPLTPALAAALLHGTSVGGARPKATLVDGERRLIAKFSSTTDTRPVVEAEFVAMTLADRAGIDVAPVSIERVREKAVILVERFDRLDGGRRRLMVSARTILRLGEFGVGASYVDVADEVRRRFTNAEATLHELFARLSFNILVGNTDDHAKNHAAFWDGDSLTLTPAYDICPQVRTTGETSQAMTIGADGYRLSNLAGLAQRAGPFHLREAEARAIIERQIDVIEANWEEACDLAALKREQRADLWGRQILNPFALEGW